MSAGNRFPQVFYSPPDSTDPCPFCLYSMVDNICENCGWTAEDEEIFRKEMPCQQQQPED